MSLKDDLKGVKGVGDATADSILDVLDDHDDGTDDMDARLLSKALDAAEAGEYRQASVFLLRANR